MKILITGASGFVGRTLLLSLLKTGRYTQFVLPVRSKEKLLKQLKKENVSIEGNVLEIVETAAPHWNGLEKLEVDHLVHCAGLLFARGKNEFLTTNVEGTLELFRKVGSEKALVLSSQAASGPCAPGQASKTEKDENLPITWYGRSKLEMEKQLSQVFKDKNYICLRPPIILGARDTATLPLFKMVKGRILFKPGFKPKYYSYISVNDLVRAIETALASTESFQRFATREFFVASDEVITDEKLITTAAQAAEKKGVLLKVPQPLLKGIAKAIDAVPAWREAIPSLSGDRAQEIWPDRWVVSSQKFCDGFSWTSNPNLLETLKETYHWYQENGEI